MKRSIFLFIIFLSVVLNVSCDKDNKEPGIEIDPYLKLEKNEITVDYLGSSEFILITANMEWEVTGIPEWCSTETIVKGRNTYLKIDISANDSDEEREADLTVITSKQLKKQIHIQQTANEEIEKDEDDGFAFLPVNELSVFAEIENGKTIGYNIKSTKTFITSDIRKYIYHGSLVNNKADDLHNLIFYEEQAFESIMAFAFTGNEEYSTENKTPSKEITDALADEIVQKRPTQNERFFYSNRPIIYHSYDKLNMIGNANLGLNLKELLFGKSYKDVEMQKQVGCIFSYCTTAFTTIIDYPNAISNFILKEEEFYPDLAYVSSIEYGRTGFLFVETDTNEKEIQLIVNKFIKDEELTEEEEEITYTSDFYYLYFNKNNYPIVKMGTSQLIKSYYRGMNDNDIIPINFSVLNYKDHSVNHIEYFIKKN